MPRPRGDLTIGGLSGGTGVKIETIRYYERSGLLHEPIRTLGGHRVYGEADVRRLGFIRRARELGFTLNEVRALLGLVDGGYTCGEVESLALRHLEEVRAKIADLRSLESTLAAISDRCAGGRVPDCPIIDALFDDEAESVRTR